MTEYATLRTQLIGTVNASNRQYDSFMSDIESATGDPMAFFDAMFNKHKSNSATLEYDRAHHVIMKTAIDSLRG
ncbi:MULTISPECIES: hypothetical protein [Pseudomonas]|uniref:HrpF protein n=2 Tax=Pseudomonas TaxID=286 RepID=A0A3M4QME5_9PSED|nr:MULTISPECIES: hypothetical protein [Pseudomonas]KQM52834.1 hypothetical protein ASE80_05335 [Pseudomonas sp. Leaf15]KTB68473.1 hypothetical protein AO063_08335 [Pseudomonas fluorescens ICMP 11288]MCF5543617.1 hypothetical protein [Pseudomonas salomonii]RAH03510.1 hypothetical protein DJ480_08980 [Pseudomonas sp. Leaf98]RMQ91454.1 hypothetical protein ALP97_04306 [Pseudomonas salomonii]